MIRARRNPAARHLPGLLVLMVATSACLRPAKTWDEVQQQIAHRYPDVRQITAADLAAWLEDPERARPILLDVRTAPEYAVSHLAGARRVDPAAGRVDWLAALPKDTPIVTYCSVGYRSSDLARRLTEAGYGNIRQLDGSIFGWANAGYPLVRDGEPTANVHPYNRRWGQLLNRERWAWHP